MMDLVLYLLFSRVLSSREAAGQQRETYFSEWAVGIICFSAAAAVQLRIYWIPPLSKVFSSFPLRIAVAA